MTGPKPLTLKDLSKDDLIRFVEHATIIKPSQGWIAACVLVRLCKRATALRDAGRLQEAKRLAARVLRFRTTYGDLLAQFEAQSKVLEQRHRKMHRRP